MNTEQTQNTPTQYKLFISRNLGISYDCIYTTNNKEDKKLKELINNAKQNVLRYYVEGDESIVCNQHKAALSIFNNTLSVLSIY